MALWTFRCYDPSDNRGGFYEWYDALDPQVMAEVDQALDILGREREWGPPTYKDLGGACQGLGEIRIDVEIEGDRSDESRIRNFRILGAYGPRRREFILLCAFEKISGAEYAVECPRALRRLDGVLRDGRRAPPCEFP